MSPFKSAICTALFLLGVGVTLLSNAVPLYSVTDLGTLGGTGSYAYGINNNGQINWDAHNFQLQQLGTVRPAQRAIKNLTAPELRPENPAQ